MDLELIPTKLRLIGLVTLKIKILTIKYTKTLFKKEIWRYESPKITKRMIDVSTKEEDKSPPSFSSVVQTSATRQKRGLPQCVVQQLENRDYTDPAFLISVAASDDRADIRLYLDIGTVPADTNVMNKQELGGPSTVLVAVLQPTGVPLFFTVHAYNSAGARSSVSCKLPTYDVTLPNARLTTGFESTSNPNFIKASVVAHDDSDIIDSFVAFGYGKGSYGDQIIPWTQKELTKRQSTVDTGIRVLDHFTESKSGRFVSTPIESHNEVITVEACAKGCIDIDHCVSFNYDFGPDGTCELLKNAQGYDAILATQGLFSHYERLGVGHSIEIAYPDIVMLHNTLYFMNLDLTNSLGYRNIINTGGILTDLSCPIPGLINNKTMDIIEKVPCETIIPPDRPDLQRYCVGINHDTYNHRVIIDGPGSQTVFNGDEAMTDILYTRRNNMLAANWEGIHDHETGILAYSLAYGRHVCDDMIHPHYDPHGHLTHESHWNNMGVITGSLTYNPFPIPPGKYYATVRAINKVEYGGPLSTTICHSIPLSIDTTKPFVHEIFDIKYNEDSYELSLEHNSTDPDSGIASNELCLGTSSRNCDILTWVNYPYSPILRHEFRIPDGVPAWLRIRAINNVEMDEIGRANQAIIVDTTPPVAGQVFDGLIYKEDLRFTKDNDKICANWVDFYDPETGITSYAVGAGTAPGSTDIAPLEDVKNYEYTHCIQVAENSTLKHDNTYYIVVWANNGGINQRNISKSSDGVRVDVTPPISGSVADGNLDNFTKLRYSASKSTVKLQWKDFYDPESGIRQFSVQISKKCDESEWCTIKDWTRFNKTETTAVWKNFNLNHKDVVKSVVKATNGAINDVEGNSDGFIIDLTPPVLEYLGDGNIAKQDIEYQVQQTSLDINFQFLDEESHVDHFKFQIYELKHGSKQQMFPEIKGVWHDVRDNSLNQYTFEDLTLGTGHIYNVRIAAVNGAGLLATHDTNGVRVDITPPEIARVYVGVLSGEAEESLDGYVWQSDHEGIKASWSAYDPQSGIVAVQYAVGTSPGEGDVIKWNEIQSVEKDAYLPCTLTDTDLETNLPVYYVSMKVRNGAGAWSSDTTSLPIIVVPNDITGIAFDGSFDDLDYQTDIHSTTLRYFGFESALHGIMAFDWTIGTSPGGENIQPYMEHGIIHEEALDIAGQGIASSGFAQSVLQLNHGETYYTTIRAITNAGNVLQATTDGLMVDTTAPNVFIDSLSNEAPLVSNRTMYQYDDSMFTASWVYNDTEDNGAFVRDNMALNWYSLGTYPQGSDGLNDTYANVTVSGYMDIPFGDVKPLTGGKPNVLSVYVKNKAGMIGKTIAPGVIIDKTVPKAGEVVCPPYVQSHSVIECSWSGFTDSESSIEKYFIFFGSMEGFSDKMGQRELFGYQNRYSTTDPIKKHSDTLYATITAVNSVGLNVSAFSGPCIVDDTPPSAGVVVELSSISQIDPNNASATVEANRKACQTKEDCMQIDVICQESLTYIAVAWTHFVDDESGIISYELAVGTSPGGGQVLEFFTIDHTINSYIINGIDLMGLRQVFVTVKGINKAGLGTSIFSNGVFISYLSQGLSPLTHIGIWDADSSSIGDIQYQNDDSATEAHWDVSGDPCPIVKYEWSIEQTDGTIIQNFTDMSTDTQSKNDQLELREGARYYSLLRVTNAFGYTYVIRSDGVTINSFPLLPGSVYDGEISGYDLTVLPSASMVTANWDGFGELREKVELSDILTGNKGTDQTTDNDPNQDIAYYEVALGTDRRFSKTRDNVVPFTNVDRNTTVTFKDLDLEVGYGTYYFTVKAHSTSYATATVTSNGFYVSSIGGVTAGMILMPDYIHTDTYIELEWDGFTSKADMMLYYIAMSDHLSAVDEICRHYVDGGRASDDKKDSMFNIYSVTNVGVSTYRRLENLHLGQNHTYIVWIMGVDKAGECNMTYHKFTVDITPPSVGEITGGPFYDMILAYTMTSSELHVEWREFEDDESGIEMFDISLWDNGTCGDSSAENVLVMSVQLPGNYTEYTITNQTLKTSTQYMVSMTAENRAGLFVSAETSPIVFDDSVPVSGHVTEGADFKADTVWWASTTFITGSILHHPNQREQTCSPNDINIINGEWAVIELDELNDPKGVKWSLKHRAANVFKNNVSNEVEIKIARDSKEDRIYSAAYSRLADMLNGGVYELSIEAADGDGNAVTGVTFWDGPDGDIHLLNHVPEPDWTSGLCDCCFEVTVTTDCPCKCTDDLKSQNSTNSSASHNETNTDSISSNTKGVSSQTSCGLQIYAGTSPFISAMCTFFSDTDNTMTVTSELGFDPSKDFHRYKIEFIVTKEDLEATWCMQIYVDERHSAEMCGIPNLSTSTKLILHTWNKNNFMLDLEVFSLWNGRAKFKDIVFPPSPDDLCRYGEPFIGGSNGIIRYEAGIGTVKYDPDIVPFKEVLAPCLPCTDSCSYLNCDASCDLTGNHLMTFTLDDIELGDSSNRSLYLIVKAIMGSGAWTLSSSNGFYIDTSPPVFDENVMLYIDVRQGEFTPSEFQGSKDTIKAIWLCNDDNSEIKEYFWAIGTSVGSDDIQSFTSTGTLATGTNAELDGVLQHNTTYYVSVTCTNEAGLTTSWADTSGVTVLLIPPDPDKVNASAVGAEPFDHEVHPSTALQTSDPTACGELWSVSPDPNVRRYDFCVGSARDIIDDIIPCFIVSYNTSGVVEIKHGKILIDNVPYYNISEIKALSSGIYDSEDKGTPSNAFHMEIGRTLFLYLRLCNKAELCTIKFINTLVITNENTKLKTSANGEPFRIELKSQTNRRQKRSDDAISITIDTPTGLEPGQSLILNPLTEETLQTEYRSDASNDFIPYIVDPLLNKDLAERMLSGRIKEVNISFVVGSLGQVPLPGPLTITFPQANFDPLPEDDITTIIHWNPDFNEWQLSDKTCFYENDTNVSNLSDRVTIVKVCGTRQSSVHRQKRSSNDTYFSTETQFAVAVVQAGTVNNPPELIGPVNISINEDTVVGDIVINAEDPDNDEIKFFIDLPYNRATEIGNIILSVFGIMTIEPCPHCYGNVTLPIRLVDNPTYAAITAATSKFVVNVEVLPTNDPPSIHMFSPDGERDLLHSDPTEPVVIYQEQINKTQTVDIAIIIAYDVDGYQNLVIDYDKVISNDTFGIHITSTEEAKDVIKCANFMCNGSPVPSNIDAMDWQARNITYTVQPHFHGTDTIKFVAKDKTGTYSDVITVTVVVTKHPCLHDGACLSLYPLQYPCDHVIRTTAYDDYYTCACSPFWSGQYCDDDIDECQSNPCPELQICRNFDGGYECHCEPSNVFCNMGLAEWKFAVIITSSLLAIVVVVFVIWFGVRVCKRKKHDVGRSEVELCENTSKVKYFREHDQSIEDQSDQSIHSEGSQDDNEDIEDTIISERVELQEIQLTSLDKRLPGMLPPSHHVRKIQTSNK